VAPGDGDGVGEGAAVGDGEAVGEGETVGLGEAVGVGSCATADETLTKVTAATTQSADAICSEMERGEVILLESGFGRRRRQSI
jgi:type IV secretory pathway TrbL component